MVTIGNGCKGISVYTEDNKDKELHVPWKDIVKISYKSDKFRMIYHPKEVGSVRSIAFGRIMCDRVAPW